MLYRAMEIESEGAIPFLDVLVIKTGTALTTKVYRKPTHHMSKGELFTVFMIELPLYAKTGKTCGWR
jgi:uncharacterized protein involved in propanediol utilization